MSPDVKRFLRDLGLLLGLPVLAAAGLLVWWKPWKLPAYVVPAPDDVFSVATGRWAWTSANDPCVDAYHVISFSDDHSTMLVTHYEWIDSAGVDTTVTEYAIQRFTGSSIQGAIRGETRLTEEGETVVWDLVLTSEDSYQWHRTDWMPWQRTGSVQRCPTAEDEADTPDTAEVNPNP